MESKAENQELPLARTGDLVVEEVQGELLVHDLKNHKTHCLNGSAAFLWRHCDGRTSDAELATLLEQEFGEADDDLVSYGLERLSTSHLLAENHTRAIGLSRRKLLARGAILVPVVASVTLPGRAGNSVISEEDCAAGETPCPGLLCETGPSVFCQQDDAKPVCLCFGT